MSDCALILTELKRGPITSDLMWRRHGIQRCGARVYDLRNQGFNIETVRRAVSTKRGGTSIVAEYHLKGG